MIRYFSFAGRFFLVGISGDPDTNYSVVWIRIKFLLGGLDLVVVGSGFFVGFLG